MMEQSSTLVHIATAGMDLGTTEVQAKVNEAIYKALERVHRNAISGQSLIKVHVGEPRCTTRMKPEYVTSSARFLLEKGAKNVVTGDTTVAYSGPRGHKQNSYHSIFPYLKLAHEHGWLPDGPAGVPFVVLDRPCSALRGTFEFERDQCSKQVPCIHRFSNHYAAGGFEAAGFVINHAHLTLHGLAGLAGCVKSIAMGCSGLDGKLRMHQSLVPSFDVNLCAGCAACVDNCPEKALSLVNGEPTPTVDRRRCIGCGECEAVCESGAVALEGENITDWQRGEGTFYLRTADYAMGLLHRKWDSTIHVLHMYHVTERCDCLNKFQEPILKRNLGFLVGKNPFALDRLAGRMLARALRVEGRKVPKRLISAAVKSALYVQETYGIPAKGSVERISIS